jgi:hypothetical protein
MLKRCANIALLLAILLVATSAFAQSSASPPDSDQKKAGTEDAKPNDLQNEITTLKAENAAVREMLRRMEEQQKVLLEQVDRLQRRLDGTALANAPPSPPTIQLASATTPVNGTNDAAPVPDATKTAAPKPAPDKEDRYQDGIIIYQNSDNAKVPFLLKFNNNTQIRFLNTLDSPDSFTDHLGNLREVHRRNDITVNRSMFTLTGYMFSKNLQYSLTVWTSAGAASIVVAGNIGWRFNKRLTLTGGYTGVPGS